MAKRTETHEKETIACRAFEQALSPKLVAQQGSQGMDYGTDYSITVFIDGNISSTYQVQVKYLNRDAIKTLDITNSLFDVYHFYPEAFYGNAFFSYSFKKATLRDYLILIKQTSTLIVCANDQYLYSTWFDDYYNYFLKWIDKCIDEEGTLSIYFHGLHSFLRVKNKNSSSLLHPQQKYFNDAHEIFIINNIPNNYTRWIDSWYKPDIIDSISRIGFSAYLSALNKQFNFFGNFNSEGFWNFIMSKEEKYESIFLCFSNFIGFIKPSVEMKEWAQNVINNWIEYSKIPVAFQILANVDDFNATEKVLDKLYSLYQPNESLNVGNLYYSFTNLNNWEHDFRLNAEFFIGVARFYQKTIINLKSVRSQKLLINSFCNFDYSINCGNAFEIVLLEIIKRNKIIRSDESFQTLKRVIEFDNKTDTDIIEKIKQKSKEWFRQDHDK